MGGKGHSKSTHSSAANDLPQVTRLERDASSGTALQETSFWLNLENALNKIHQKRHSPEVTLTLDVLKAGKRFHATVSFDSDTGKQRLIKHRHAIVISLCFAHVVNPDFLILVMYV